MSIDYLLAALVAQQSECSAEMFGPAAESCLAARAYAIAQTRDRLLKDVGKHAHVYNEQRCGRCLVSEQQ
jgi:hypothetical protein